MSGALTSVPDTHAASAEALDRLDEMSSRFTALVQENEDLGRELLRCYEQLSLLFEITEHIANLRDPSSIQEALLRRYGTMLGAGAIYHDRDGECVAVTLTDSVGRPISLEAATLRAALRDEIEAVRESLHARVPTLSSEARDALAGAHVLLGSLRLVRGREAGATVVIALREANEPCFDSGDMLASESVLGYGGHIVSNVLMVRHLQQTAVETVGALANAIDAKDNYTSGHSERVGWLAKMTGRAIGVPEAKLQELEWAGLLHDVGKIGIPERILNKPGKLTKAEFDEMKKHPRMSHDVLLPVASLGPILDAVLHHHENHDGSGYPDGLAGEDIPLAGRVLHVVDIFDALTSTRSYRKSFTVEQALAILSEDSGRVTDPNVTEVFIALFRRYMHEQHADFHRRFAHIAKPDHQEAATVVPPNAPEAPGDDQ
ncbi:MAG: HD-GYP domain-containing protein [Planctomycetes bacterium]|nr:HD-GYP domain-containing protein [Planctomycetota bacterium]